MRLARTVVILAAAAATIALVGCTADVPVDGPEPIRTHPMPSATPTPSPTRPALAALVVSPAGLGSLLMGAPVPAAASDAAMVAWRADACETDVAPAGSPATNGLWTTTYPDDPTGPIQPDPFRIGTVDAQQSGAVDAIEVFSPQIKTATGIHIGSSVTELKAAYPGGFAAQHHGYFTDVYAVDGPRGRLLLEVYDGSENAGGRTDVALISVVLPGTAPFALIPGDGLLGCPV